MIELDTKASMLMLLPAPKFETDTLYHSPV